MNGGVEVVCMFVFSLIDVLCTVESVKKKKKHGVHVIVTDSMARIALRLDLSVWLSTLPERDYYERIVNSDQL